MSKNSDAEMTVFDVGRRLVYGFHAASFNRRTHKWSACGGTLYNLRSNGLDGSWPGSNDKRNAGHRGVPPPMFAVRRGEIRAGAIRHVLKIAVNMTSKAHVFPMTNSDGESSARYAPPEGTRLRLKPWINLKAMHLSRAQHIVAAALQRYGAIIGDQSGGPVSLKLSQGRHTHWGGILGPKSLRRFRLSDFEVVRLGYRG